jgi:hypothetical protein
VPTIEEASMACKGKICSSNDSSVAEIILTECECGLEKIIVRKYYDEHHYPEDDFVFLELIHYPESLKERWKDFIKGHASHEVILSKKEFFDFVEKLNELAKEIELEAST